MASSTDGGFFQLTIKIVFNPAKMTVELTVELFRMSDLKLRLEEWKAEVALEDFYWPCSERLVSVAYKLGKFAARSDGSVACA